jgi:hypothetical protein
VISNNPDTPLVANSGGTNIAAYSSARRHAFMREDLAHRILTRNTYPSGHRHARPITGKIRLTALAPWPLDRPQYLLQAKGGRISMTRPTETNPAERFAGLTCRSWFRIRARSGSTASSRKPRSSSTR